MGIISIVIDLVGVSAAAAAVRRGTGYSAKEWVCSKVPRQPFRALVSSYFNMGEAVVFSVVKYAEMLRVTREARLKDQPEGEERDRFERDRMERDRLDRMRETDWDRGRERRDSGGWDRGRDSSPPPPPPPMREPEGPPRGEERYAPPRDHRKD